MSDQARQIYERLLKRVEHVARKTTIADLLAGCLVAIGLLCGVWLLMVSIEAGFWLPERARSVAFWLWVMFLIGVVAVFVCLPLLRVLGIVRRPTPEAVAYRVGAKYPEVSDKLLNMLQLANGKHSASSDRLVSDAVAMLGREIETVPIESVETFERPLKISRWVMIPLLVLAVFLVSAPVSFFDASLRLLQPGVDFARPARFSFLVQPGHIELLAGSVLDVSASVSGQLVPTEASLEYRREGEDLVERVSMTADSSGIFSHSLVNVRTSLGYRFVAGEVSSEWYQAVVLERPSIQAFQVTLTYPRYTRIPRQVLDENVGDITALRGTVVSIDVRSAGALPVAAFTIQDDGRRDSLTVDGRAISGGFRVLRNGSYQIVLESDRGVQNDAPITYQIRSVSDQAPSVTIVSPPMTHELSEEGRAAVVARIADDFGFRRLRLNYRMAESRFGEITEEFEAIDIELSEPGRLAQEVPFDWAISETTNLEPVPGDIIEYFLTVWDNDSVSGYKSAESAVHRLVVPSLADKLEELQQAEDQVLESMDELVRRSEEVKEQFDELKEELQRDPTADWEDERQLEQLQQKQAELESGVEELSKQLEELASDLEENEMLSPETLEMFQELQRVVEEINSPELQDALQELREAMDNMDMQQLQDALQDFEFDENLFQDRLDRSLELLKKLQVQQELDEASKMAEDLAERQEEIQEETQKVQEEADESGDESGETTEEKRDRLAEEQERSSADMEALEEQLKALEEKMEQLQNMPQSEMEELRHDTESQKLPQQMQENAEQLKNNELGPAQENQQQMQQQLQQLQQNLGEMQAGMQGMQMQIDMAGLRRALSDILLLSEKQEDLKADVAGGGADGAVLRSGAREQVELADGLKVVSDSLVQLARRIPQMSSQIQTETSKGLRAMGDATSALTDRVTRQATSHQRASMMHLNELALMLSDLMGAMNQQPQAGGAGSMEQMMQQLQEMAGNQQKLNEQIQKMLNDMAGQRLTQDMQERLRQMAGQQDALRRQLKEMSRNPEMRGKALGDLSRIAEQMAETIEELERSRASRKTIQRQQQILTRLLEATRSLQQRGEEKRRESKTGDEILRDSPDSLSPTQRVDELRRDLIRALEAGYAPDYEELIKRYFEMLQQRSVTNGQ